MPRAESWKQDFTPFPKKFVMPEREWQALVKEHGFKPSARIVIEGAISVYRFYKEKLNGPPPHQTKIKLERCLKKLTDALVLLNQDTDVLIALIDPTTKMFGVQNLHQTTAKLEDVIELVKEAIGRCGKRKPGQNSSEAVILIEGLHKIWLDHHPLKKSFSMSEKAGGSLSFSRQVIQIADPKISDQHIATLMRNFIDTLPS